VSAPATVPDTAVRERATDEEIVAFVSDLLSCDYDWLAPGNSRQGLTDHNVAKVRAFVAALRPAPAPEVAALVEVRAARWLAEHSRTKRGESWLLGSNELADAATALLTALGGER